MIHTIEIVGYRTGKVLDSIKVESKDREQALKLAARIATSKFEERVSVRFAKIVVQKVVC